MKNIIHIILLLFTIIVYGQRKVGVNTPNPKQTLDVEGTLRISNTTPGNEIPNEYLAILPNDNSATDRQIVGYSGSGQDRPFQIVNYTFHISKPTDEFINGADLDIDSDNYTVLIMQYRLVDENNRPIFIQAVNATSPTEAVPIVSQRDGNRGKVERHNNNGTFTAATSGFIATPSPLVMVYPEDGTWKLYADYPNTKPASFVWRDYSNKIVEKVDLTKKYSWKIKMLIIKNTYVHTQRITVSNRNGYYPDSPLKVWDKDAQNTTP
ncbi:MAG: hypothetical protein Q4A00_05355 [Flavobacteriaceae bacterium]|nr:hypothetical protein [Flavobacteriaceae bacterium]